MNRLRGVVVVELLGEEFAALVNELHGRVRALQAGESVERLVLLEAESGSGKSRVVRELYTRMRSTQTVNEDGDGYWPALDEHAGRGGRGREALPTRKVIGPPTEGFVRPPGTLPDFFWLQVQCAQAPSEALIPAIELVWPSLRAHANFVAEAWRQKAGLGERGKRAAQDSFIEEAQGLGTEASVEALSRLLGVFDIAVPGLGWIATKAAQAGTAVYRRQKFKGEVEAGGELGSGLQPPEELALQLLRMAHRELPLIVVVEDAHLMDPGLAEMLRRLAEPDPKAPPVLVITTAWPEGRTREGYQQWRQALLAPDDGPPRAVLVADGSAHPFPSLTLDDRVRIVREHAPATDQATAELIATKWTNPYALRLAVSGDRMCQFREGDAFVVTLEDLDEMPEDIEDLYRDRWVELPDPVRQALMLAAGALPEPSDDGSVWPFLTDVVAQAVAQAGLLDDPDVVSTALDEAVDPFEWARLEDRDLDLAIFREWVLQRIARERYRKKFVDRNARAFTAAVGDEIARRIDNARGDGYLIPSSDPIGLPLSRWLLALQPDRDDEAAATGALTLALGAAESRRFDEVVRLLVSQDPMQALPPDHGDTIRARRLAVEALWRTDRFNDSILAAEELVADLIRVKGPDANETLEVREDLGWALNQAQHTEEAITLFRSLVADRERISDADNELVVRARVDLARALVAASRYEEALAILPGIITDLSRVSGPEAPATLEARELLACALSFSGRHAEALAAYRALLLHLERVNDPEGLDALDCRSSFAQALGLAGLYADALQQHQELLPRYQRTLGPLHPETLAARYNLAQAFREAGQWDDAIASFHDLASDESTVLGVDHPDVMLTRDQLALALRDSGRFDEAVSAYEELLTDQSAMSGEKSPWALMTRSNLGWALTKAGQTDRAIATFRLTLEDMTRELGPDHPEALMTLDGLAEALVAAGQVDDAIDIYRQLALDLERLRGADHWATAQARDSLASLTALAEREPSGGVRMDAQDRETPEEPGLR